MKRFVPSTFAIAFFFLLAGSRPTTIAFAQGQEDEINFFRLDRLDNKLRLEAETEREERRLAGSDLRELRTRLFFREGLEIKSAGSFYHPNFLKYDLDADLGISQEKSTSRLSQLGSGNELGNRFHLNTLFLKERPYFFNLFAQQGSFTSNREFFERVRTDTSSYGGTFNYRNQLFPASLSYTRLTTQEDREFFPSRNQESTLFFQGGLNLWKQMRNNLSYSFQDSSRQIESLALQRLRSHRADLSNQIDFGPGESKHANSSLRFFNQRGDLATTDLGFTQNLGIDHSRALASYYSYNFDTRTIDSLKSITHQGRGLLRHQLYESLTSRAEIHFSSLGSTSLDRLSYGSSLSFDYRKKIRWGEVTGGYGFGLDRESRQAKGRELSVFDESVTLTDGVISLLATPGVDISSIVVTDLSGFLLRLGTDYEIIPRGDRVEIRRIFGGGIPNGSTVLVDYRARAFGTFAFNTLGQRLHLRLDLFERLVALYYRHQFQIPQGISGQFTNVVQRFADRILGTEVKWRWLRLNVEQQEFNSNLVPFRAIRFDGSFDMEVTANSAISLKAGHSITQILDTKDRIVQSNFTARYGVRFTPIALLNFEGEYRKLTGRALHQNFWGLKAYFETKLGLLRVKSGSEVGREISLGSFRRRIFFFLRLERQF